MKKYYEKLLYIKITIINIKKNNIIEKITHSIKSKVKICLIT